MHNLKALCVKQCTAYKESSEGLISAMQAEALSYCTVRLYSTPEESQYPSNMADLAVPSSSFREDKLLSKCPRLICTQHICANGSIIRIIG